jgi:hypothetical protein
MVKQKYGNRIVTNVPLLLGPHEAILKPSEVHDVQDAILILDEAWLMLPSGTSNSQVNAWLAYLRKQNQHILLPSVLPLARQVSHFAVERSYNLLPVGLPYWVYRWKLKGGSLGKKTDDIFGTFFWNNPKRVFGYYDHTYRPNDNYYVYKFD